ncbi:MAG TPA: hypothetical protein ENN03_02865 [bacterium]|nr:hypothetical protein [bacterium]
MRILFTSDLHGNPVFYQDILRLTERGTVNRIILGGDLLPGRGHGDESLKEQHRFIEEVFIPFLEKVHDQGLSPTLCLLGNNDWQDVLPRLSELDRQGLLWNLHDHDCPVEDCLTVKGYPFVPPTPFPPKDFEKRDLTGDPVKTTTYYPVISIEAKLRRANETEWFTRRPSIEEDLAQWTLKETENTILVMHSPPHDTMLDRLYNARPAGSRAIRAFIETHQPLLTLHGHVHESPVVSGKIWDRLGKTLCINPGQSSGLLSALTIDPRQPERMTHTVFGPQTLD